MTAESDSVAYVSAVVMAYVELPDTPLSPNLQDHRQARQLHDRGIPLRVVESARHPSIAQILLRRGFRYEADRMDELIAAFDEAEQQIGSEEPLDSED